MCRRPRPTSSNVAEGPRKKHPQHGSARHRGRARRSTWNRKERHPGDTKDLSKNAKVAMVLVMYNTLRRGDNGLLHGPLNKRTWATFAGKKEAIVTARREAQKRGFDPSSESNLIQIVTDGDDDLARMAKSQRSIIERSRNYILRRSDKLDYAWLRDQDLEIGIGAVEGAVNPTGTPSSHMSTTKSTHPPSAETSCPCSLTHQNS